MPELIKIYWRDIPSQVTAKAGRRTAKVMLPSRFQEAIDRAAMRAGKGSSDAYMEDWRRERSHCSADLQAEADAAAAALIDLFNETSLEALVKVKGIAAHVGLSREELNAIRHPSAAQADSPGDPLVNTEQHQTDSSQASDRDCGTDSSKHLDREA